MGCLVHFVGYLVHFGREKVNGHLRRPSLQGDRRIEVNFLKVLQLIFITQRLVDLLVVTRFMGLSKS